MTNLFQRITNVLGANVLGIAEEDLDPKTKLSPMNPDTGLSWAGRTPQREIIAHLSAVVNHVIRALDQLKYISSSRANIVADNIREVRHIISFIPAYVDELVDRIEELDNTGEESYVSNKEEKMEPFSVEEIKDRFAHHPPTGVTQELAYEDIRARAADFAVFLCSRCPPCRERSLAITKLEEASMWCIKGMARNGGEESK